MMIQPIHPQYSDANIFLIQRDVNAVASLCCQLEPHLNDVQDRTINDTLGDHVHKLGRGDGVKVFRHIGADD